MGRLPPGQFGGGITHPDVFGGRQLSHPFVFRARRPPADALRFTNPLVIAAGQHSGSDHRLGVVAGVRTEGSGLFAA